MSRILILANDYKTIANFRLEVLEALLADGHTIALSVPEDDRNDMFAKMGCRVRPSQITRHGTNPVKELALMRAYRKLMKQEQPDIVLSYTVKPNVYGSLAARRLHFPIICNVTGMGSVLQGGGLGSKVLLQLQKAALSKANCVFFQNRGNLEAYQKAGIVHENADLLPGSGVNLKLHGFSSYPSETDGINMIIVSRLRQDKGYDEFFSMVDRISQKHKNVRFHVVGWIEEERYRAQVEAAEKAGRLVFHGEKTQEEVHALIASSHCLIHPSYHEGMANVLMEAASAGRPCLASNIHGCMEAIEDGVTGFTFKVKDAEALTDAVERFLSLTSDERAAMGKAGREKMEQEFDRNIVIAKYKKKIAELTAPHTEA